MLRVVPELDSARQALEASATGLWSWDLGSDRLWWDAAMCAIFRVEPGEGPSTHEDYLRALDEEDRARVTAAERAVLHGESSACAVAFCVEHRVACADGAVRWVELRGGLREAGDGRRRLTGTAHDCTARKESDAERREQDEAWRVYTELASDYAYLVDIVEPSQVPSVVAGSFERTTGMTVQQVAERGGWVQVLHPEDRVSAGAVFETLLRGQPAVMEYRIVDGDGQVRWLRDRARPMIEADGTVRKLRGAVQEITEQRRLEEQLVSARKHEALARFSGGVAHDFNNMLTVVLGAEEIARRGAPSEDALEALDVIHAAVGHAADLIRGMLLFARQSAGAPHVYGVTELITEQLPVLRKGLGPRQRLHVELSGEPAHIRIDSGHAQLMLLNIIMNARHASPPDASVWLRTEVIQQETHVNAPAELEPGRYSLITVRDEGVGIAPEALPRIFEPYFTTREPGVGTGLGLSACQGIATRAGGVIDAVSELGQGATLRVYLPLTEPAVDPVTDRSELRLLEGGTETVLLVDDEPMLRRVFARALRDRGYDVEAAESAEQALERLEARRFDLVVSDIVMPGMGGLALAAQVSARWPETAILLMSGNIDARSYDFPFLAKPMSSGGMARRIRELLDGDPPD